ncbi:MAG: hypothetical protein JSS20_12335 [Proteobacteria bacterium]|nr:hypothetical protein [Pseudomonadota bacterium]
MADLPTTCLRCQGPLEAGFLLERGHSNHLTVQEWVAGEPKKSWLIGLKTKGERMLPVDTLRCTRCGRLESFAKDAPTTA